ncbi:TPA: hypothetical protein KPJ62_003689 [Clostridioides difficile]|nr:hypothetical protein [Clostridioides difficile]
MNNKLEKGQVVCLKCSKYNHELKKSYVIGTIVNKTDEYIEISIEEIKSICRFYSDTLEEISMVNPRYYICISAEVI